MIENLDKLVSIEPCQRYDPDDIERALEKCLAPSGGIEKYVKQGQRVALKINLLMSARPETATCTHPAFTYAVARMVKKAGGEPFIIDSPGASIPNSHLYLKKVYKKAGYELQGNIPLNEDLESVYLSIPEGRLIKRMECLKALREADVIINLPKIKTHCFMILTCAVKNMFGAIPGLKKVGYHSKLKKPQKFGAMLLDVYETVKPDLNIIDGITGMEGSGPSGGEPKNLGVVLASSCAVSADLAVCRLIGFNPKDIPYLSIALEEGIPSDKNEGDFQIVSSVNIDDLRQEFKAPETLIRGSGFFSRGLQKYLNPLMNHVFTMRPEINRGKCVGCKACIRSCPEEVIELVDYGQKKVAKIKNSGCIRCYCCHEMCPHQAVDLKRSLLFRLVNRE